MRETDYLSENKLKILMIKKYNLLMSMPHAEQKAVFNTLLTKYNYKNFDSLKQTFARLKRTYPDKFKLKKQLT